MTAWIGKNGYRFAVRGVLTAPLLVLLLALLIAPLMVLTVRSFTGQDDGLLTLANYAAVVSEPRYRMAFVNSALLAVFSTVLALIICLPAALYIERTTDRGRRLLAVALSIPLSLPGIVIGFFVILNFGNTGMVTRLVEAATGARDASIAYQFGGLLLGYLYFQIPRVMSIIRSAAAALSEDAILVARTLGATTWDVYLRVIVPALRAALVNAATLSLATAFGAFGTAATLSRGYRVVPLEIAAAFTENYQPERAASLSLVLALVTLLLLIGVGSLAERRLKGAETDAR